MKSLISRLRNLIKPAIITGPADNSLNRPVQQVSYKGVVSESLVIFPYGMYANVANNAYGVMFSLDANDEQKAIIAAADERPDDLEQDETAFYHPKTESFIKFRNNGDIEIESTNNANLIVSGNMNVTIGGNATINIAGDANITSTGDTNVKAANVNIDAAVTNLGVGGLGIARIGDTVQVEVVGGSSAGPHNGTITSSGGNTSI